jgi:hypothetical protein
VAAGWSAASVSSNSSSSPLAALVAAEVAQVGHQQHVLPAGEQLVYGRELTGDADGGADGVGLGLHVVAGHQDLAAAGRDQGGEDLDGGGLAGAVGPEQGEDGALGDGQVDAVQDGLVTKGLAQAGDLDGWGAGLLRHAPMLEP